MVQRPHFFAIVDEVDSILIDEARTPLIISGPSEDKSDLYNTINGLMPKLVKEDYDLDEKQRTVNLTEAGNEHIEDLMREAGILVDSTLYDAANVTLVHHVQQALKAHKLFNLDKDYIVRNGEVVIIDEFTGRMMPGRRFSEGLHQALEAKEAVQVMPENVTLASITFQNYFRLYKKLAGMTGTASTEADEFAEIYKLEVVEIPTNRPVQRLDEDDEVYRTVDEKVKAIIREIEDANSKMQPMLVGTTSIEKSEQLGEILLSHGYKQIDFDKPQALQQLYASAREGKPSTSLRDPECALPRTGSLYRRGSRRARRDHHRHQHGGPRHRHSARRQRRHARRAGTQGYRGRSPAHRARGRDPRRNRGLQAEGDCGWRPLHRRHRTPRKPPHRQPAARPLWPSGRSRPLQVLPVAAGRSHAHLRIRAHGFHADDPWPAAGRSDCSPLDQQGAGKGPAKG